MVSRIAAFVGLLLLAFGGLLVAERISMAQSPPAAAPQAAQPAAPAPAQPAAEAPKPQAETKPAPVAAAPPAKPATPVANAPLPKAKPAAARVETPLPPSKPALTLREKDKGVPAKFLFGAKKRPSAGRSMAIGYYPRGCLQGGIELPINGPHWEVMRLSRNRNWGHPELVRFLKRFSAAAAKATGWKGILVGDMAQPRGGPLPFGHTQSSDRARRRHLVHADARPHPDE